MAHTLSTAATLNVGDWIIDPETTTFQRIVEIRDNPATDIEGASRFVHHTGGLLAIYACEPIAVQA